MPKSNDPVEPTTPAEPDPTQPPAEPAGDPVPPRTVEEEGLAPPATTAPQPTTVTEWPDYVEEHGGDVGTQPADAPKVEDWDQRVERTGQDDPTQDRNEVEGWDDYVTRKQEGAENAQATQDPEPPTEPRGRKA